MKTDFIKELTQMVAKGADDCTMQDSLRDILTDLRHVANRQNLDFEFAVNGSAEVYDEEVSDVS